MKKTFDGRSTGKGAYTQTRIYASDGSELCSERESSRSGNHWKDTFDFEEGVIYLNLTEDYSNSGKDNSYACKEGEGKLSEFQIEIKMAFEKEHNIQ